MRVVKRDGRVEEFKKDKLINSMLRAGISKEEAEKVTRDVEKKIYDGITTDEILKIASEILQKISRRSVAYNLKSSLLRLGPAGYRFEKFVAILLAEYGFKTKTNEIVKGKCVEHEVDVIAEKDKAHLIECKFHNSGYSGIKEVLYSYARFLDLKDAGWNFDSLWIFTNTKFSLDAIKFAVCRDIKLTGWRYPENEGIEVLLEQKKLYPLTILSLKDHEIEMLLRNGFAFCNQLLKNKSEVRRIIGQRAEKILSEAAALVI